MAGQDTQAHDAIDSFDLFMVAPRWLFLRIRTRQGLEGWGEPIVEGRAATVAQAVEEMGEYLIGQDPNRIEDIWQVLFRGGFYRGGPVLMSAIAGIDQALWDLKGRRLGVPIYDCLGGAVRDRMRVYAWIGGDDPLEAGDQAKERVAQGFTALKMNGGGAMAYVDTPEAVTRSAARIAAVRQAVGPEVGVAVDFHGRVHRAMAKMMAHALEPYDLMFIEEPVLPEHLDALGVIFAGLKTPIATGERLFHRWDFKRLLEARVVDIIQPDLSHAGGITEVRKIATMAEAYDVALAPHCPLGPIALASCLQVDAVSHNALIQEQSLGIHYNVGNDLLDYLKDAGVFSYHQGYCAIPSGPGLGIDIDGDAVERAAQTAVAWRNPVWRLGDGSIAEW